MRKVSLFNAVRAVGVLVNSGIFHHVLGGVVGERTAGNLDGGLGGVSGSSQAIVIGIGAQLAVDGAAGDTDLSHLALGTAVVHRDYVAVDGAAADRQVAVGTAAVRPGRYCAVDRAALDGSSVPVLNGVAVSGIQRTAVQEQIAAIDLNHDEIILGKRAALDIQAGVLGDAVIAHAHQRRALPACGAAVIGHVAALEGEPASVLNVNT